VGGSGSGGGSVVGKGCDVSVRFWLLYIYICNLCVFIDMISVVYMFNIVIIYHYGMCLLI
jgi:hypothetical protein